MIRSTVKGRNVQLTGAPETSVLKKINTQQLPLVVESYWLKNKLKSVSRNKVEHAKTPGERLWYIVFGLDLSEIKKLWAKSVTTDTDFDAKLV